MGVAGRNNSFMLGASRWNLGPQGRVLVGISRGRRTGRLKTALLLCRGHGWSLRVQQVLALSQPPRRGDGPLLADSITQALEDLVRHARLDMAGVEVIGLGSLTDPSASPPLPSPTLPGVATDGFCAWMAALLAERTGVTVVSDFPLRDRAAGGAGSPLYPVADWLLFHGKNTRLLVHLGFALTVTLLPAGELVGKVITFDVGPCCGFLDGLASALSHGRCPFDPNGQHAVQGRQCEELIRNWSSHPFLLRSPPRFLEGDEFGEDFLQSSLAMARSARLSARDLLCSANHFVIRNLRAALHRFLPGYHLDEVWVTGGGAWNGLLWKLLQEVLAPIPTARADDADFPLEVRASLHAALMAYCTMENLTGNLPGLTGATRARVLGQITPGDPDNWDRWVCNLADRMELAPNRAA